jgi:hypothetical protein
MANLRVRITPVSNGFKVQALAGFFKERPYVAKTKEELKEVFAKILDDFPNELIYTPPKK